MRLTIRYKYVLLFFMVLIHADVHAQFVRFNLSLKRDGVRVEADPFEFKEDGEGGSGQRQVLDANNQVIGVERSGCIQIAAPENINVIVHVGVQDVSQLRGRPRPVNFETKYINDGEGCPTDTRLARAVSKPFSEQGNAYFYLDQRPRLAQNLPGSPSRVTGFIYMIGQQKTRVKSEPIYQGRIIVDIEYF
jgi:hypothetical protein